MTAEPAAVARAIRRNRRRCVALQLELRTLERAVDLGAALPIAQARQLVQAAGALLERDAAEIEHAAGLPPQDGPPPKPPRPKTERETLRERHEALRRSTRGR